MSVLLRVDNLQLQFAGQAVIKGISFSIARGETFALVGESGSGKSLTAMSVLRLQPRPALLEAENIQFDSIDILRTPEAQLCKIRGRRIAIIFQDPMSSLNPVMTVGAQISESLRLHFSLTKAACKARVLELLEQVGIPDAKRRMHVYPHQLSGGQRQRIMIAIALSGEPDLLIADEPTTALDVTVQKQILALLQSIQKQTHMALWIISHDLALVSTIADRVAVMKQGKIVELAENHKIFTAPEHEYTQALLAALPNMYYAPEEKKSKSACLLLVKNLKIHYPIKKGLFQRTVGHVKAVDGVSFKIEQGKTLAIVGESGCGKTSLGKGLLNLVKCSGGIVEFEGCNLANLSGEALRVQRAAMQIIFQDPFAAMNPRMLILDIIVEGMRALQPDIELPERITLALNLLEKVGLEASALYRYPHEFSGGQRQRICIARALAVKPKLIICDEPTSALDVSVQKQIIHLLKTLQRQQAMSYLFISHDLAVVAEIADEVAVMYQGKIVEHGVTAQILQQPLHAYTQKLISAVPVLLCD